MNRQLLLAVIACRLLLGDRAGASAPPPALSVEPTKGTITSGVLVTCFQPDYWSNLDVRINPLNENPAPAPIAVAPSTVLPPRWHVAHGALWIRSCLKPTPFGDERDANEALRRYELSSLLLGRAITAPGAESGNIRDSFAYPSAGHLARRLCFMGGIEFSPFIETDILALGSYEVRQFVLCNVRGKMIPRGTSGHLMAHSVVVERKDRETPHWSFQVLRYKGTWDKKTKEWQQKTWSLEESLPVQFKESFQVLGKGEDWYFITKSGKLYLSRKPAKGKKRTMELVWNKSKRRIVAFITDADKNCSFLFCKVEKPGAKPTYFELSDKPKPVAYTPPTGKVPEIKVSFLSPFWHDKKSRKEIEALEPDHEQNAKRQEAAVRSEFTLVYRCAKVLQADKKITLPKPKKK